MNIVFPKIGTRHLQRKLYLKAKRDKTFCFYTLYDKIYRPDILQRAYDLVKENDGAPGVDGRTFKNIEHEEGRQEFIDQLQKELQQHTYQTQAIKRVYIPKGDKELRPLGIPTVRDRVVQMATKLVLEPIFEADFSEHSFGYRPKRHAHQAMDAITKALRYGYTNVIDADLSKYFDSIPHRNLLQTVAERVSDGELLALLVNIYLNLLDRIWLRHEFDKRYGARLIRYADDMVILCRGNSEPLMQLLKAILNRLELTLNTAKTKVVNAYRESFNFLGFTVELTESKRTGKWFPQVYPARKAILKLKDTRRHMTLVPINDIVRMMNDIVRGWGNYFRYGNCFRSLRKVRTFCENRLRFHLCYRHKMRQKVMGFVKFSRKLLYGKYKLYELDIKPKWKTAHALG